MTIKQLCVRGRNDDGEWLWCACEGGKDPQAWAQDTRCGMHVLLPGHYSRRTPDCPQCIAELNARGAA